MITRGHIGLNCEIKPGDVFPCPYGNNTSVYDAFENPRNLIYELKRYRELMEWEPMLFDTPDFFYNRRIPLKLKYDHKPYSKQHKIIKQPLANSGFKRGNRKNKKE